MEEKKQVLSRRKYDTVFKAEVLKLVASGQTVAYVSQALGVSENLIYRWKQHTKGKKELPSQWIQLRCQFKISSYKCEYASWK